MRWPVKECLSEEEIRSGQRYVIGDAVATQAIVSLTTGALLVAYALEFGASNLTIGLLAAVPPLAQLVQIPSVHLVQKIGNRRAISFYSCIVSRSFFLLIGLSPLIFPHEWVLPVLLAGLSGYGVFAAICTCSWNSWMRDLIPAKELGRFNAKRMAIATSLGMATALGAAQYIDWFTGTFPDRTYVAYSSLFVLAFAVSLVDSYFIASVPEPAMESNGSGILSTILHPLRNPNFRRLLRFLCSWNCAINLAAPFFAVYMLSKLGLSVFSVIALGVLGQIMNLLFFRVWGGLSDRFSNKSVLRLCGPLFIVCIFGWTFTSMPDKHVMTIPLLVILHILMGVATAGTTLGAFNIAMKLAPKELSAAYLASAGLVNSLAAGLAPVAGGYFADFFAQRQLALTLRWTSPGTTVNIPTLHLSHWDFFFFIAVLLGCLSIYFLGKVQEEGEVENRVILQELVFHTRRRMRNLSTVGGIRWMVEFPFSLVKQRRKNKNNKCK
ncbi:MAG: MFS transporter [Desulfomonilaceae bacterium]|nr:MFS transporter [Desulfomonilaceae bacterium]